MPIYEYKCSGCGEKFEEIVSVSATENPPCPTCKSESTEKLMSGFASFGGGACGSGGGGGFS